MPFQTKSTNGFRQINNSHAWSFLHECVHHPSWNNVLIRTRVWAIGHFERVFQNNPTLFFLAVLHCSGSCLSPSTPRRWTVFLLIFLEPLYRVLAFAEATILRVGTGFLAIGCLVSWLSTYVTHTLSLWVVSRSGADSCFLFDVPSWSKIA